MIEPAHLGATRASYDAVAETYAERFAEGLARHPLPRLLLRAFAEQVLAAGGGPVLDAGCGPGHVTASLAGHGLDMSGIDLSPRMIAIARRTYPHLRFEVGSLSAIDAPDGWYAGLVASWSIFHLPPAELPAAFAGFRRVLRPGGHLILGFHAGDERLTPVESYGHPVTYEAYLLPPTTVAAWLTDAGFTVTTRLDETPPSKRPQAMLMATAA
ncbi:MAG TPA: class I SAM-dependent methyltransferase [Pseudonocardiaceae bacterium]